MFADNAKSSADEHNQSRKRVRDNWIVQGPAFWYATCEAFSKRQRTDLTLSQKDFIQDHPHLKQSQAGTFSRNYKKYRNGELHSDLTKHKRQERFQEAKTQMIQQLVKPENRGISKEMKLKLADNIVEADKPTNLSTWLNKVDEEHEKAKLDVKKALKKGFGLGPNNLTRSEKTKLAQKHFLNMDPDICADWVDAVAQELLVEARSDTQDLSHHSSEVATTTQGEQAGDLTVFMDEMSIGSSICSLSGRHDPADESIFVPSSPVQADLGDEEAMAILNAKACVRSVGQTPVVTNDEKSKATSTKSEGACSVADIQSLLNGTINTLEMKSVFGSTMKEQFEEALSHLSSDSPIDVAFLLTTSHSLQVVEESLAKAGDFDAVGDVKRIRESLVSLSSETGQQVEPNSYEVIIRDQEEEGNSHSGKSSSTSPGLSNAQRLEGVTTAKEYIDEAANLYRKGDLHNARAMAQRALSEHNQLEALGAPDSLESALSYNACGMLCEDAGDIDYAKTLYQRAIEIQKSLAPGSLALATSYNNIGSLLRNTGDLLTAKDFLDKGLRIREQHATESMAIATSYNNLGLLYIDQGDVLLAKECHLRALEIQKKISPYSQQTATSFQNLGRLYESQAFTDEALNCYVQAASIDERYAPDTLETSKAYTKIAEIYNAQGDSIQSLIYFHKSEQIITKQNPLSKDAASLYKNIGLLSASHGDFLQAWNFYHKALNVEEQLEPDSLEVAYRCNDIGMLCESQSDEDQAWKYYQRAIRIQEKHAGHHS